MTTNREELRDEFGYTEAENEAMEFENAKAALLDRVERELPELSLQDVIDAKLVPTPEEHKKMVGVLKLYKQKQRQKLAQMKGGL